MWNVNLAVPTCKLHQQTTTEEVFTNEETTQCVYMCVSGEREREVGIVLA